MLQNISGTHAATWQQKLAGNLKTSMKRMHTLFKTMEEDQLQKER